MIKNSIVGVSAFFAMLLVFFDGFSQSYKNLDLHVETRVKDLINRMTLEEKVAQLRSSFAANPKINAAFFNNSKKVDSLFGKGISMINPDFDNSLEQSITNRNKTQDYLLYHARLGIPAIFLDEAHHGLLAFKADVFPMSISLACSWDTLLTERIYTYVAAQSRARGTSMVLAPVIDVTRDPRWGRTGETFGEDPYLCGLMGSAVVRGLQGSNDGTIMPGHVAATLKHFTGHGQSEGGDNQGPADFPERVLRTFHMEPFRLAISWVKPAGIMPAYVETDGVPAHANSWLLKDVLRKEWGYKGVLVSDWWAIDQLYNKHRVAVDQKDAARQAFNAGVTVDLPYGNNFQYLVDLVKEGKVSTKDLDKAVSYVLTLKFKLGLFDEKEPISLAKAESMINKPEGRALALKAAEESMVLLKNEGHLLPLKKDAYKTIAVIGPCAATNYTGDYSGVPVKNISMLNGIQSILAKSGSKTKVVYAKGVDLSLNGDTISLNNYQYTGRVKWPNHESNLRKIDSAVAVAKQANVVILAVGENEQFSREAGNPDRFGDAASLDLQSDQEELVKAIVALGKPVVVYLAHGRPLSVNYIAKNVPAILDGWYTGEESGNAAANILFGDVNPSGKLTISIPKSIGQLPVYYNHKPSAQYFEYVHEDNKPLWSFGFGLSYTTYKYGTPKLVGNTLSVDVTNTGAMKGDEIAQWYVHPKVASVTQPVKALKGFSRIALNAGETKTVSFKISKDLLAYYTKKMKREAEPGIYELSVGPNSNELQRINYKVTN